MVVLTALVEHVLRDHSECFHLGLVDNLSMQFGKSIDGTDFGSIFILLFRVLSKLRIDHCNFLFRHCIVLPFLDMSVQASLEHSTHHG